MSAKNGICRAGESSGLHGPTGGPFPQPRFLRGLDGRSRGLSAMAAKRSKTVLRRGDLEVPASKDPIGWPPTGRTTYIMSCLSWNYRGLASVAIMNEFRELVKNVAPTVLCVLETQVH
jgi:hypothetical protein